MKKEVVNLVKMMLQEGTPKGTIFYYVGKLVCKKYDLLEIEKEVYKFKDWEVM